jgi:hypothetical protein
MLRARQDAAFLLCFGASTHLVFETSLIALFFSPSNRASLWLSLHAYRYTVKLLA